ERDVAHAQEHLAVLRRGHRPLDQAEVLLRQLALRLLRQQHLAIDRGHVILPQPCVMPGRSAGRPRLSGSKQDVDRRVKRGDDGAHDAAGCGEPAISPILPISVRTNEELEWHSISFSGAGASSTRRRSSIASPTLPSATARSPRSATAFPPIAAPTCATSPATSSRPA